MREYDVFRACARGYQHGRQTIHEGGRYQRPDRHALFPFVSDRRPLNECYLLIIHPILPFLWRNGLSAQSGISPETIFIT
jgi:hypothetical protein